MPNGDGPPEYPHQKPVSEHDVIAAMPISADARAVTLAILQVAKELRLNRESLEKSPGWKMAELSLRQVEAAMGGGVVVVPGGMKPNH